MKTQLSKYCILCLLSSVVLLVSPGLAQAQPTPPPPPELDGTPCGTYDYLPLSVEPDVLGGWLFIYHDNDILYLEFQAEEGWLLAQTQVEAAITNVTGPACDMNAFRTEVFDEDGKPDYRKFAYKSPGDRPATPAYAQEIPLSELGIDISMGGRITVMAHAAMLNEEDPRIGMPKKPRPKPALSAWAGGDAGQSSLDSISFADAGLESYGFYFCYDTVACEIINPNDPCQPVEGEFRTYGLGGWGHRCRGHNANCYRDANFEECFPEGLLLGGGCEGACSLLFEKPIQIDRYLPSQGKPDTLCAGELRAQRGWKKPRGTANVLAGQALALSLNVGFDRCDPDFSPSSSNLGDLYIHSTGSPFDGLTIDELLAEANLALGGCEHSFEYTLTRLAWICASVNASFEDGHISEWALEHLSLCPPEETPSE